jgi:hypothetical protein
MILTGDRQSNGRLYCASHPLEPIYPSHPIAIGTFPDGAAEILRFKKKKKLLFCLFFPLWPCGLCVCIVQFMYLFFPLSLLCMHACIYLSIHSSIHIYVYHYISYSVCISPLLCCSVHTACTNLSVPFYRPLLCIIIYCFY